MAPIDMFAYKNLYLESSRDYLEIMKKNLSVLKGDLTNKIAIYELFRCAHSLKSQNFAMGYHNSAQYCAILEEFFHRINEGKNLYSVFLSDSITSAITQLDNNLDHIKRNNNEIISPHVINNLKHRLGVL